MARRRSRQPQGTGQVDTIREALERAAPRPDQDAHRGEKKNYAERLSRHLATCFANALRGAFPGIIPTETGEQHESPARTSKGMKKLDVNYSTPQLGLALGVSEAVRKDFTLLVGFSWDNGTRFSSWNYPAAVAAASYGSH
jgi:hypothetical protein